MKKYMIFTIAAVITVMLVSGIGGCTYEPAKRYMQTDPNTPTIPDPNVLPDNLVGRNNNNNAGAANENKISATFEMVDYSYIELTVPSLTVRSGVGLKYPAIGEVKSGQKLRALGKLDGWYAVKMPDSGRIGCIQASLAKPYGGNTTTTAKNEAKEKRAVTPTPKPITTAQDKRGGGTAAGSGIMTTDEAKILQLVNAERLKAGAKALSSNDACTKLARMKSQDMVSNNYFSHQSPTYGSPFDMLKSNKVSYTSAGENIAMNQTATAAFNAWMNSEGHRKNILNPNFTSLGVGIIPKGNGSYIYTQLFIGE